MDYSDRDTAVTRCYGQHLERTASDADVKLDSYPALPACTDPSNGL